VAEWDPTNPVSKALICVSGAILKCFEKIVDYVNCSAYAMMAATGQNFCKSGRNALLLQLKNTLGFAFSMFLAKAFMFVGKIGVAITNCAMFYVSVVYVTKEYDNDFDDLPTILAPMAICLIASYHSAHIFLNLFDDAVLAMMTSYAVDLDINKGRAKWGPASFHHSMEDVRRESIA